MKIHDELVSFLDEEAFSDVTLRTSDGSEIRAHKVVLASKSRYALLKHNRLTLVFNISFPIALSFFRKLFTENDSNPNNEYNVEAPSKFLQILVRQSESLYH